MSGDHNMNQTDSGWRKRQIALNKKADNARELGLDYEPNNTIMEMARDCGINFHQAGWPELERFVEQVREEATAEANEKANTSWTLMCEKMVAIEREACAKKTEEFARKWWKIHCDSNLHYSSTLKAHQDFCALQAAIRARSGD